MFQQVGSLLNIAMWLIDHYGLVPSLDHYLHVDGPEIRSYFFQVFDLL